MTWLDILSTAPELALVVTALVLLMLEVTDQPPRQHFALVGLAGLAVAAILSWTGTVQGQFYSGMIAIDSYSHFFDLIFILIAAGAHLIAVPYLRSTLEERGEYYSLLLFATVGMMFMAKAHDLTITFLGLELLSISLYILVGFYRNRTHSNEAGLKYLLLGAFSTGFFLLGIALIYGSTASTHYDAIKDAIVSGTQLSPLLTLTGFGLLIIGFAFKVALVPFHMYAPDVYEGAPTAVTAFISTGPKVAGFAAFLKVIVVSFAVTTVHWHGVLWLLAVLSMTVGNISALRQDNLKRMLAYSSIAHAGYLAMGLMLGTSDSALGMLYYLVAYAFTTLGAFAVVATIEGQDETGLDIDSYKGLSRRSPVITAIFALCMLSLAGFPPTAGFIGKFFIFSAAIDEGYFWLVIIGVLNSVVSVYYYLRPIVAMYMEPGDEKSPIAIPATLIPLLVAVVLVVVILGIFPVYLVKFSTDAALVLF